MTRDLVDVPATTAENYPYASAAGPVISMHTSFRRSMVLEKCVPNGRLV